MKRLILTNDSSAASHLGTAHLADFVVNLERQLVWGRSLSDNELSGFFGERRKRLPKIHWLDHTPQWRRLRESTRRVLDWPSSARASIRLSCGWIRTPTTSCS